MHCSTPGSVFNALLMEVVGDDDADIWALWGSLNRASIYVLNRISASGFLGRPYYQSKGPAFGRNALSFQSCAVLHSSQERSFFFLFIHYSHAAYQIMARICTVRFLSAVRVVVARCKRPFALRPGLSQEDVRRTKETTKERRASVKDKGKDERRTAVHHSPP